MSDPNTFHPDNIPVPSQIPDKGRLESRGLRQTAGPVITEPKSKSRITVIEHVIYSTGSSQPHAIASRFARNQETEEQPYKRVLTITEEWSKLDPSWIKICGMMVVSNEEGKKKQRTLSVEGRAKLNARIVEVYFEPLEATISDARLEVDVKKLDQHERAKMEGAGLSFNEGDSVLKLAPFAALLLPPGESQRYTPSSVNNIWFRCQSETAKIVVTLIPG